MRRDIVSIPVRAEERGPTRMSDSTVKIPSKSDTKSDSQLGYIQIEKGRDVIYYFPRGSRKSMEKDRVFEFETEWCICNMGPMGCMDSGGLP